MLFSAPTMRLSSSRVVLESWAGRLRDSLSHSLRGNFEALRSSWTDLPLSARLLLSAATLLSGRMVSIAWRALQLRLRRLQMPRPSSVHDVFHKVMAPPTGLVSSKSSTADMASLPARPVTPAGGQVFQIVLTGGPVGGKASCADRLANVLRERGYAVIVPTAIVPMLLNSGTALAFCLNELWTDSHCDECTESQIKAANCETTAD